MENRIKDILSEKGLTAKELSSVIGLSSVSLYNIINGKQEASANTLNAIATALNDALTLTCPHCGKDINIKVE